MSKTLIVIDFQNDFVNGPLGTQEARSIIPNVKKKVEEYRARGDKIIFTKDTHFKNYLRTSEGKRLPVKHCIIDTYGYRIVNDIDVTDADDVLNKECFGIIDWYDVRKVQYYKFEEIEIIGVCTDICVVSNALILRTEYPDCEITVDASCCAGTTPDNHKAALAVMKSCHINIIGE